MALKSLCPEITLADPAADKKTAKRVGQYRVSDRAIYFPAFPFDKYLPFDAIRRVWTTKYSIPLVGCCGKSLPAVMLRIGFEGGFYQEFSFETQEEADGVVDRIVKACPQVPVGPAGTGAGS